MMIFFKSKDKAQEILPPPPPILADQAKQQEEDPEGVQFPDLLSVETGETEFDHFDDKLIKMEKSIGEKFDFKSSKSKSSKIQKAKPVKTRSTPKTSKETHNKAKTIPKPKKTKPQKNPATIPKSKTTKLKQIKTKNYGTAEEDEIGGFSFDFPDKHDLDFSFEDTKFPKEAYETQTIEEEISQAISNIRKQEQKQPKKSLFGIFSPKNKKDAIEYNTAFEEKELPVDDVEAVTEMIKQARKHLENLNLELSKKAYLEIIERYNRMDPKLQSLVYQEIRELYSERKNAESMKIN